MKGEEGEGGGERGNGLVSGGEGGRADGGKERERGREKGARFYKISLFSVKNVLQWVTYSPLQISKAAVMQVVLFYRAWVRQSSSVQTVLHW